MNKCLCFILTHGNLASELDAVLQKLMPSEVPFFAYSNTSQTIENIVNDMEKIYSGEQPENVALFIDLLGGSCWHAAMGFKKNHNKAAIITGVNIPALISFNTNFNRMNWDDLLEKVQEDARKAIKIV